MKLCFHIVCLFLSKIMQNCTQLNLTELGAKVAHGPQKQPLYFVVNQIWIWIRELFNGIFTTMGHGHTPCGRVMFRELYLPIYMNAWNYLVQVANYDILMTSLGRGLRCLTASALVN